MSRIKISKSKKIKIIKIIIFVIAGSGILFLLYPSYTNIVTALKQKNILSEWEAQKETLSEDGIEPIEAVEGSKTASDNIAKEDNGKSSEVIKESDDLDIGTDNNADEEIVNYEDLNAEDFFPLKIRIPKIDLEWIVNEGTDRQTLKEGPGHIIDTPLPGDDGRCTISGHRTTYGAPFNKIDELIEGDLIYLETIKGKTFVYAVTGMEMVDPKDVYILEGTDKRELLLTSCYPEYSAAERIILISELINIYPLELASTGNK
ncbi:hypothetical protein ES708_28931 [subsurface metagenome]